MKNIDKLAFACFMTKSAGRGDMVMRALSRYGLADGLSKALAEGDSMGHARLNVFQNVMGGLARNRTLPGLYKDVSPSDLASAGMPKYLNSPGLGSDGSEQFNTVRDMWASTFKQRHDPTVQAGIANQIDKLRRGDNGLTITHNF